MAHYNSNNRFSIYINTKIFNSPNEQVPNRSFSSAYITDNSCIFPINSNLYKIWQKRELQILNF